jgi:hypothetical protein
MNREQAIELARKHAKAKPQSYYAEPFQPHEWVVDAILEASSEASDAQVALHKRVEAALTSGWACPACGAVNGPAVQRCPCHGNKTLRERVSTP